MNKARRTIRYLTMCCAVFPLLSFGLAVDTRAETYIGGQIGTTFFGDNNKLARVDLTEFSPAGSMSGRDLATSPVFGGKIGHYFQRARWLGLELEASYTTPHIEQQPTRFTVLPGSVLI